MTAIRTQDLTKRFGGILAVDGLNLEIEEGELFALLGVNGAGKTTTIGMLSCLTAPSGGDAFLLGDSVVTSARRVKEHIAVSPQESAVAPNLTVRENLELIAGLHGASFREARARAAEFLETFGFGPVARHRARTLSGGWRRRLSIAMALISRPRVLFLDEPTLGLDVLARRQLWDVIQGLKGGHTVILTTHYLEEAVALSDRIGILAGGKLRAVGAAAELLARTGTERFEDAFVALAEGGSI